MEVVTNEKQLMRFTEFQRVLKVLTKHLCKKVELTKSLTNIIIWQHYPPQLQMQYSPRFNTWKRNKPSSSFCSDNCKYSFKVELTLRFYWGAFYFRKVFFRSKRMITFKHDVCIWKWPTHLELLWWMLQARAISTTIIGRKAFPFPSK